MMRKMIPALICLLCALSAPAADRYVWQDSSSPGSPYDSWSSAAHDLQTAIDAASSGDTLYIRQGAYTNTAQLTISGKNLTLSGGYAGDGSPGTYSSDPTLTVIDGAAAGRVLYVANCTSGRFERLTFRNGSVSGSSVYCGGGIFRHRRYGNNSGKRGQRSASKQPGTTDHIAVRGGLCQSVYRGRSWYCGGSS